MPLDVKPVSLVQPLRINSETEQSGSYSELLRFLQGKSVRDIYHLTASAAGAHLLIVLTNGTTVGYLVTDSSFLFKISASGITGLFDSIVPSKVNGSGQAAGVLSVASHRDHVHQLAGTITGSEILIQTGTPSGSNPAIEFDDTNSGTVNEVFTSQPVALRTHNSTNPSSIDLVPALPGIVMSAPSGFNGIPSFFVFVFSDLALASYLVIYDYNNLLGFGTNSVVWGDGTVTGGKNTANMVFQAAPGSLVDFSQFADFNLPPFSWLSKAGEPTAADIPSGYTAFFKNTSTGHSRLWHNDAGTLKEETKLWETATVNFNVASGGVYVIAFANAQPNANYFVTLEDSAGTATVWFISAKGAGGFTANFPANPAGGAFTWFAVRYGVTP